MAEQRSTAATSGKPHPRGTFLGAMFLMATAAIGPGFITQTTTFTAQLGAAFAFAILVSTLIDIAVQINVWRVLGVSGERAHELAGKISPIVRVLLALFIVSGGLAFNIGNVAGTGLGLQAALPVDARIGAVVSAVLAVGIFLTKRAGATLDRVVVFLGILMIALMAYVAFSSQPPVKVALREAVAPSTVDFFVITTLIGGTVGGYMTYAGAHRLIDAGISGADQARRIANSSVTGVLITALLRILLFMAILGVVHAGTTLSEDNPTASVFRSAAGEIGQVMFGVVFWAAAMTSVIGASFTSMTFLTGPRASRRAANAITVGFIVVSLGLFLVLGQAPVTLLIFAGAFNGLVLPIGFTVVLYVAWRRRDLMHGYAYPRWLLLVGLAAWLLTLYLGWNSMSGLAELWT